MRYHKYKTIVKCLPVIKGTLLLSGCHAVLLEPKGQIAIEQRALIITAFCLMLVVVIPVVLMAVVFTWKYRTTNTTAKYTPDWSHSNKVEAVVWTVPVLIILFLAVLTWKSTHALDPSRPLTSAVKPIDIEVISLDWKWLFIYPQQGIATVNQIVFPVNTPLNLRITSNSVMNGFFIPALGSQIYAMPGMQTRLHLIAGETGTFNGISSSYSGRDFSGMKFKATAVPDNTAFEQWIADVKKSPDMLLGPADFEKMAEPDENHPVEFFSVIDPTLFRYVTEKFKARDHDKETGMTGSEPEQHLSHRARGN
ncbi:MULTISPECIES: ubiquinol oxidase subunit II [Enterobacterales]|uniref:Ubiquinol oxidase subunit 2 n=1 Tax=Pluralibacter gergoviae TaxID=61647 RepID=A0AAW8HU25_PLUGE|nr:MULTISPECIES: ubiquinol oxidase subunit II [Enterobacteriaceae]EKF7047730.1 ubiquinol oxidase subunit II [Escherichia coli]EKX6821869.1 ubiquinol oxidase subunit II [Klebsiella pneumoniae]EKY2023612.1 ubiquinol oxidase subunit II [Cronobacter sakazakii]MDQ2229413.1 ubiquinol oxidase subunit II [Citrobacter portucalensis]AVR04930.1 ubiquinol oxidase subunit II [Pluralibacter gergoviae]